MDFVFASIQISKESIVIFYSFIFLKIPIYFYFFS